MATYNDYPQSASNNAKKVLAWKKKYGKEVKGMTPVGWARAKQLASKTKLSYETIARMAAFNRHRKNAAIDPKYKDTPWKDRGYVAWLGWGGTSGVNWAIKKAESIRRGSVKEVLTAVTTLGVTVKWRINSQRKARMEELRNLPKHLKAVLLKKIRKALERVANYLLRL